MYFLKCNNTEKKQQVSFPLNYRQYDLPKVMGIFFLDCNHKFSEMNQLRNVFDTLDKHVKRFMVVNHKLSKVVL